MKTRIFIFALALIGITTACIAKSPTSTAEIVGTWQHNDGDDIDYLQFNADGTGYEWEAPRYVTTSFQPVKKPFKYEIQNGRLVFLEADGDIETESLRIVNSKKIRIDHDTYTRQK